MLKITQCDLKICIKRGLGFTQICEKYQCNQEELNRAINNLFESHNAARVLKDINQNTQRIEKNIKKAARPHHETRNVETSCLIPREGCPTEDSPVNTVSDISLLDQLKSQETTLSGSIMQLESEHKNLIGKHRSNLKQLHQLHEQMKAIRRQFQAVNAEYEKLVISNNQLVDQINLTTERHHTQSKELQEIREKIQSLEKIPICIYIDGRIEPLDDPDFLLDDTGNEDLYQQIITEEPDQYQDLRLRDIKTISRVLAIIKNSTRKFDFIFEDENLESHFLESSYA